MSDAFNLGGAGPAGSGYSGASGYSAFSGLSGFSGIGTSGWSGSSGSSGISGFSGTGSSGGGLTWVTKTANYTANVDEGIVCDTSDGAFTITLPATPTAGDEVDVLDAKGSFRTNNLTVGRNSSNIQGAAADLVLDIDDAAVRLIYSGATDGWKIFDLDIAGSTTGTPTVYRGLIDGLTLSNAADSDHDITVAIGVARDSTDAYTLGLATAITKQLDAAWAVGTNAGGLDTGSIASAWYHVFLIRKDSDGSIDALFSTSATAPTMPAGYTFKRRIGSVLTDGSSNIIQFIQIGDEFIWYAGPIADVSAVTQTTTRTNYTFSTPLGVRTRPIIHVYTYDTASWSMNVTSPEQAEGAPPSGIGTISLGSALAMTHTITHVPTNTSSQLAFDSLGTDVSLYVNTYGYFDSRGRDA